MHSPAVAEALVAHRWDVVAVAAEPSLRGSSDAELFEHVGSSGQVLVTENVGDFSVLHSDWLVSDRPCPALVFTNPRRFNRASLAYPGDLITALNTFLSDPTVHGGSWIWWLEYRRLLASGAAGIEPLQTETNQFDIDKSYLFDS